ncbi:MAG: IS3 family transposase [Pseudomonadota bacterium]
MEHAELALFQYIEAYYNRRRRHSTNGWLSPATFEEYTIYGKTA